MNEHSLMTVAFFMGVDAWLSLSINVTVNQVMSPHHQIHKKPVEPKWQETLNLVTSRPKLCNNCSPLMNSNPELLQPMISKQRAYFSFKCSLRLWYFSQEKYHYENTSKNLTMTCYLTVSFLTLFGNSSWIHQHTTETVSSSLVTAALSEPGSKGSICLLLLSHEIKLSNSQPGYCYTNRVPFSLNDHLAGSVGIIRYAKN